MIIFKENNIDSTVRVRSWLFFSVFFVIFLFTFFVIFGIFYTSSRYKNENVNHEIMGEDLRFSSKEDVEWYKNNLNYVDFSKSKKINNYQLISSIKKVKIKNNAVNKNDGIVNDLLKIMSAPISSNELVSESFRTLPNSISKKISSINGIDLNGFSPEGKESLFSSKENESDVLDSNLIKPISKFQLQAGSIIPAILITGINSDLPGTVIAQVRQNVYDTVSGNYLIIPQGSKLIGIYDSKIIYGQQRLLIAWRRLIFSDGSSINLKNMPGTDTSGYGGFMDEVNNHYSKIFGSVILLSIFSTSAQVSQPQNIADNSSQNEYQTVEQSLAQNLGINISNTSSAFLQKNINIQPTLIINPGYFFNVIVTKDIIFNDN